MPSWMKDPSFWAFVAALAAVVSAIFARWTYTMDRRYRRKHELVSVADLEEAIKKDLADFRVVLESETPFVQVSPEIGHIPAGDPQEAAKIARIKAEGEEYFAKLRSWFFNHLRPIHASTHKNFKKYKAITGADHVSAPKRLHEVDKLFDKYWRYCLSEQDRDLMRKDL